MLLSIYMNTFLYFGREEFLGKNIPFAREKYGKKHINIIIIISFVREKSKKGSIFASHTRTLLVLQCTPGMLTFKGTHCT